MDDQIRGLVHISSQVRADTNWEGKGVVELRFFYSAIEDGDVQTTVVVDRATAARLINQLRRALDDEYNRAINERPGGSDDY